VLRCADDNSDSNNNNKKPMDYDAQLTFGGIVRGTMTVPANVQRKSPSGNVWGFPGKLSGIDCYGKCPVDSLRVLCGGMFGWFVWREFSRRVIFYGGKCPWRNCPGWLSRSLCMIYKCLRVAVVTCDNQVNTHTQRKKLLTGCIQLTQRGELIIIIILGESLTVTDNANY